MSEFGKVVVLFGGASAEREVSLLSGGGVLQALLASGVDAQAFDPAQRKLDELAAFGRAFIALHGRGGEDGTIQGALELMGVPYTGSGVMASALGMDKWRTKLLWRSVGLPIPDFALLSDDSDFAAVERQLGLPLFVKPACEGSSIGVTKVRAPGELVAAYRAAAKYDRVVLAEKAILGGEYTCTIIGDEALPVTKIEPATDFYDYDAKYFRDDTQYRCPCDFTPEREAQLRAMSLEAFRVLGCRGWARIDFLMDEAGRAYLLEANTSPGMTSHSLVPMAARAAGMSYEQLVVRLLSLAALG